MLNLELLEKKLDEVLGKETPETMTSWLLNRRSKMYISLLGEGDFAKIPSDKFFVSQSKSFNIMSENEDFSKDFSCELENDNYLLAA